MSKFDGEKILEHLTRWEGRNCPMCGKGQWTALDSTYQLTEYNDGSLVLGGPVVPVIPITCGNCGNTALVNAIVAKIVVTPSAPGTGEPSDVQ